MLQSTGLNWVLRKRGSAGFLGSARRAETLRCLRPLRCLGSRSTVAFHGITPPAVQIQATQDNTCHSHQLCTIPGPAQGPTSPTAHPALPQVRENTSWGAGKDLSLFPLSPAGPGSCPQVSERGTEGSDGMKGPLWSPPAHKSRQLTALLTARLPSRA